MARHQGRSPLRHGPGGAGRREDRHDPPPDQASEAEVGLHAGRDGPGRQAIDDAFREMGLDDWSKDEGGRTEEQRRRR